MTDTWKKRLPLSAVTRFSLQDFPGRSACILWLSGCQMRCSYCHNPELALGRGERISVDGVLSFLERRKGQLDGVVLSGGECLLSSSVLELVRAVKSMGYLIKVDTNGGYPDRLDTLLKEGLVDYVAMDFKARPGDYEQVTGWGDFGKWEHCYALLQESGIDWELRTTVHSDIVGERAVDEMMDFLDSRGFGKTLYLQLFRQGKTLGNVADMRRRFELARLCLDRSYEVRFRNFTQAEVNALVSGRPLEANVTG
ncbi:anaerobic ribonucleoside-triphosphate reductase activating protein [Pelagicoccus sp. SDUM812005]|uniref:anaerobic ribonucleoside-triphosphate reductase activating protein n=1 Tax=Pelagicoccus sp. SDUM812005 TaxID=3041257 RepID=UPI00280F8790|nr:anaerobic ribonucleoside-triphosphate reductase activating protein [Pelagicoccus sp. SDUM812005]MDQ8182283.1 anaerobic ribonucleoside-triphosphate reductase activating protein [Pelagicoccus sp. SDUM812005]